MQILGFSGIRCVNGMFGLGGPYSPGNDRIRLIIPNDLLICENIYRTASPRVLLMDSAERETLIANRASR